MRSLCAVLFLACLTLPLGAADAKWVHVTSPHFDLYTSESEGDAKNALNHLESVRAYFIATTAAHDPGNKPVRIVAFKADGDYARYRPEDVHTAKAFGLGAGAGPATVVASSLKPEVYETIFREYVQLALDDSVPATPYWFRGGLATMYSTLKPVDGGMTLGTAPKMVFRGQVGDIDLQLLFSINRNAYMTSREKSAGDFYAATTDTGANNGLQAVSGSRDPGGSASSALATVQSSLSQTQDFARASWVLVHMLMFQQNYRGAKFSEFRRTVASGVETGAAFTKVYEAPMSKIQTDLALYGKQPGLATVTVPFKAEKPPAPEVKPVAKEEQDKVLADLVRK